MTPDPYYGSRLIELMQRSAQHWHLLGLVQSLNLPDCWIAAGFVRNAVWSELHGQTPLILGDVDVIWFDPHDATETQDARLEQQLRTLAPDIDWSVCNQARMHVANGDRPYKSSEDAMRYWPETATAVAVKRTEEDNCELITPFGLDDLYLLKLRPAGRFATDKQRIFQKRVVGKSWLIQYPGLTLVE